MIKKLPTLVFIILMARSLSAQPVFTVSKTDIINPGKSYLIAPKWSPDGKYIAAAGVNYGSIWLDDLREGKWHLVVEANGAGWDFTWSPDSRKIAFRANVFENRRKKSLQFDSKKIHGNLC